MYMNTYMYLCLHILSLYGSIFTAPEYLLSLQGGRFDHPNRLFHSIAQTWQNVLVDNVDLKEVSMIHIQQ